MSDDASVSRRDTPFPSDEEEEEELDEGPGQTSSEVIDLLNRYTTHILESNILSNNYVADSDDSDLDVEVSDNDNITNIPVQYPFEEDVEVARPSTDALLHEVVNVLSQDEDESEVEVDTGDIIQETLPRHGPLSAFRGGSPINQTRLLRQRRTSFTIAEGVLTDMPSLHSRRIARASVRDADGATCSAGASCVNASNRNTNIASSETVASACDSNTGMSASGTASDNASANSNTEFDHRIGESITGASTCTHYGRRRAPLADISSPKVTRSKTLRKRQIEVAREGSSSFAATNGNSSQSTNGATGTTPDENSSETKSPGEQSCTDNGSSSSDSVTSTASSLSSVSATSVTNSVVIGNLLANDAGSAGGSPCALQSENISNESSSAEKAKDPPSTSGNKTPVKKCSVKDDETLGSPSPGDSCSICLGPITDACVAGSCLHRFCFPCLKEWSNRKPVCPLCKRNFTVIIHDIKGEQDYKEYTVPAYHMNRANAFAILTNNMFQYMIPIGSSPVFDLAEFILPQGERRPRLRTGSSMSRHSVLERRRIYNENLWVRFTTNQRYRESNPDIYSSLPALTHRLVPWVSREFRALQAPRDLVGRVMQFITQHRIISHGMERAMRPYLHNRTRHFLHEFNCFAHSSFDMIGYDTEVQGQYGLYVDRVSPPDDGDSDEPGDVDLVEIDLTDEPSLSEENNEATPSAGTSATDNATVNSLPVRVLHRHSSLNYVPAPEEWRRPISIASSTEVNDTDHMYYHRARPIISVSERRQQRQQQQPATARMPNVTFNIAVESDLTNNISMELPGNTQLTLRTGPAPASSVLTSRRCSITSRDQTASTSSRSRASIRNSTAIRRFRDLWKKNRFRRPIAKDPEPTTTATTTTTTAAQLEWTVTPAVPVASSLAEQTVVLSSSEDANSLSGDDSQSLLDITSDDCLIIDERTSPQRQVPSIVLSDSSNAETTDIRTTHQQSTEIQIKKETPMKIKLDRDSFNKNCPNLSIQDDSSATAGVNTAGACSHNVPSRPSGSDYKVPVSKPQLHAAVTGPSEAVAASTCIASRIDDIAKPSSSNGLALSREPKDHPSRIKGSAKHHYVHKTRSSSESETDGHSEHRLPHKKRRIEGQYENETKAKVRKLSDKSHKRQSAFTISDSSSVSRPRSFAEAEHSPDRLHGTSNPFDLNFQSPVLGSDRTSSSEIDLSNYTSPDHGSRSKTTSKKSVYSRYSSISDSDSSSLTNSSPSLFINVARVVRPEISDSDDEPSSPPHYRPTKKSAHRDSSKRKSSSRKKQKKSSKSSRRQLKSPSPPYRRIASYEAAGFSSDSDSSSFECSSHAKRIKISVSSSVHKKRKQRISHHYSSSEEEPASRSSEKLKKRKKSKKSKIRHRDRERDSSKKRNTLYVRREHSSSSKRRSYDHDDS